MVHHKVKIVYRDEIYKTSVKGYREIVEYVDSNVLSSQSQSSLPAYKLRYRDSDGDEVVLKSEKDLLEAIEDHEDQVLELSLEILAPKNTTNAPENVFQPE